MGVVAATLVQEDVSRAGPAEREPRVGIFGVALHSPLGVRLHDVVAVGVGHDVAVGIGFEGHVARTVSAVVGTILSAVDHVEATVSVDVGERHDTAVQGHKLLLVLLLLHLFERLCLGRQCRTESHCHNKCRVFHTLKLF